jgi:hypothetical protein
MDMKRFFAGARNDYRGLRCGFFAPPIFGKP